MRPISFIKFRKRIETSRIMVVEHNFDSMNPSSIIWNVRALYWAANCPFLGCSPIFYGISLFNNCKITWQSKWIVEKSLFPSTSYISSWNIRTNALAPISWCIALKRLVLGRNETLYFHITSVNGSCSTDSLATSMSHSDDTRVLLGIFCFTLFAMTN